MNVLLVLPNVYLDNRIGDHESKEPLGLLYLTSFLRKMGHNVSILQADYFGLSVEQVVEVILFNQPGVVGLSITQRAAVSALKVVRLLRKRGYLGHITAGGYLPTLCAEDLLTKAPEINSLVLGEGEETLLELVNCLDRNEPWQNISGIAFLNDNVVHVNECRPFIEDLDMLPFPARDLLKDAFGRMGYTTLISSRGCYGNCTFCPQNAFKNKNVGAKWRGRSPENVVDEIEKIILDFGISMFKFSDDDIFGPGEAGKQRVIEICEEIDKRRIKANFMAYCRINDIDRDVMTLMRRVGFERLLVGVESSMPNILKEYKKGIQPKQIINKIALIEELGFSVIPGFMMFNPYSTLNQLENDLSFLRKTKSFGVSISKTVKVHDATELKSKLLNEKRLKLVPFDEGYHEYTVSNEVARVFKALKLIWSKLIDPIQAEYQGIVTQLKKTASFNAREEFEEYLELIWEVQAKTMTSLIERVRNNDVDHSKIAAQINIIRKEIDQVIDFLCTKGSKLEISLLKKFRFYLFKKDVQYYCLDLTSSIMFEVDKTLFDCLRVLVGEQSTENLSDKEIEQINILEQKGLIRSMEIVPIKIIDTKKLVDSLVEILQDFDINVMRERYFWKNSN